jgi:hypothetical protein
MEAKEVDFQIDLDALKELVAWEYQDQDIHHRQPPQLRFHLDRMSLQEGKAGCHGGSTMISIASSCAPSELHPILSTPLAFLPHF